MKLNLVCVLILFGLGLAQASEKRDYPAHWWEKVPESQRQGSWEILPHEAKKGELILSKRNELGQFSNFGHTPFILDGVEYASVEALWQMMKYPDVYDLDDPRIKIDYPYSRLEVIEMFGFEAKKAGDLANEINKQHGFDFVSYQGHKFDYKDRGAGSEHHYQIIRKALIAKVFQNNHLKQLLLKTKGLILKPDHHQGENRPKSYFYHEILMDIRDNILK
ncbi:MAG: hypothetical protein CME62_05740 [Halobacteriovoraceae bacterium]|nr:hypothetical protein [Halobacteriovoraceae bacterium]|tara:strand:+ start:8823 stop:9482 length:660 start_codon:yes stop_codon:yes gene_type:complete